MGDQIVLFESEDSQLSLDVRLDETHDTVWLTKEQMAMLFGRDRSVISRHISNIYSEDEIEKEATCAFFAQVQSEGSRQVERQVEHYNLDVVISVGYRVKSKRGVEFRALPLGSHVDISVCTTYTIFWYFLYREYTFCFVGGCYATHRRERHRTMGELRL